MYQNSFNWLGELCGEDEICRTTKSKGPAGLRPMVNYIKTKMSSQFYFPAIFEEFDTVMKILTLSMPKLFGQIDNFAQDFAKQGDEGYISKYALDVIKDYSAAKSHQLSVDNEEFLLGGFLKFEMDVYEW